MGFTVDGFNRAKSKMAAEFNKAITDAARLRKDAAKDSSGGCATAPASTSGKSTAIGASADASPAAVDRPGIQVDEVK